MVPSSINFSKLRFQQKRVTKCHIKTWYRFTARKKLIDKFMFVLLRHDDRPMSRDSILT